ncbi:MAG: flavin reductase family protein [Thermoanaerobaculia bacterium]|jgi:flavin reductase (DIM6/NTAB) family NADH-FMN oxidoreductase RutF|nr:flavin reductase family protein [Thermoanaerobaculia bacterium]
MPVSADDFRNALRHFPAGVTLVTLKVGEEIHGLTVSAFVSVSPDPPLIAVIIDDKHRAHELLERPGTVFAVNILGEADQALSDRFAWGPEPNRFAAGRWTTAATGAPILVDAVAWLDCTIASRHPAGSHTIYVGAVQASAVPRPEGAPLLYWNRDYRRLKLGES